MDEDVLPYSSINLAIGESDAALTAMCQGVRLHIEFTTEELPESQEGAGRLRQQFLDFRNSIDDEPGAMEAFEDWLLRPCVPQIRHLAVSGRRTGTVSLQDYFRPDTLVFSLLNVDGSLEARRCPDDPSVTRHLTPRVSMSDQSVSSAIQERIPCLPASQVDIVREPDVSEWEYDAIPKFVRSTRAKSQLFFKAAFEKDSFRRELDILMRIRKMNLPNDLCVSKLAGLAQWEDEPSIAGLLIEYIPDARTLDWAADEAPLTEKARWAEQIRDTLEQLHEAQIIWGDVKPSNVVIDSESQAWVVDFGGGFSPHWVDKELAGTKDGDSQGLARITEFLGVGSTKR